ncbi:MAG: recombinase family protein [Acutalibacteraceae bacterium]|nr:recombinase family protein [Acutalibacteraceae bacterium]
MAIRTTLYGYQVKNGKTVIHNEESDVVKKVFSLYIEGKTLNSIASMLTEENVAYFQDEVKWNKNTINRMLENEKYMGNEIYPMIISSSMFNQAKTVKDRKSCKQETHTPEVELFRKITVCGKCGSRFKRVNTWGSREKWMCSKGCQCSIYIDDAILEDEVTSNLNMVITNPDLLNVVADSQYMPTIDVTKEENELIRLLEQPKLNFSSVAKCVLQGAKVRFDCCNYDNGELTEELKDEISVVDKIDYKIMKEYIKQVIIQSDGRIITVFINNAKITNGGAENAS